MRTASVLLASLLLASCVASRPSARYEIPATFHGWAEIEFERPACPPLRTENGAVVFNLSNAGKLCTSDRYQEGWAKDEYFRIDATGRREPIRLTGWGEGGLIWGLSYAGKAEKAMDKQSVLRFFVGTEAEYKRAVGPE